MNTTKDQDPLVRLGGQRPAAVCTPLEIEPDVRALLEDDPAPALFLQTLIQREQFQAAATYLAHGLSKPDAVAWAAGCMAIGRELSPKAQAAVAAALAWSQEPTEENCRAAEQASEECDDKACQFAATAAFWSGESLAPPEFPPAPPPPDLTGKAVFAALAIAASHAPPKEMPERWRQYLSRGILIARAPL